MVVNTSEGLCALLKARGAKGVEARQPTAEEIAELDVRRSEINHYLEILRRFEYDSRRSAPNIITRYST